MNIADQINPPIAIMSDVLRISHLVKGSLESNLPEGVNLFTLYQAAAAFKSGDVMSAAKSLSGFTHSLKAITLASRISAVQGNPAFCLLIAVVAFHDDSHLSLSGYRHFELIKDDVTLCIANSSTEVSAQVYTPPAPASIQDSGALSLMDIFNFGSRIQIQNETLSYSF